MIIVGKNLHFAVMKGGKIQLNNTDYPQKGNSIMAGLQRKTTRTTIPSCFVSGHWTELFFTAGFMVRYYKQPPQRVLFNLSLRKVTDS